MDEEDILDSQKEIKTSKIHDKRFKINFLCIFICCIIIMVMDQVIKYLDSYPELFYGADYIFHISQSIINICSQLAVSISAAIIFYYVLEFINEKKKLNHFIEIRKYMLFILYKHMEIICNIKSFKNLNRNKKRLNSRFKFFCIVDIPILLKCYNNCNKKILKKELSDYFIEIHKTTNDKDLLIVNLQNFNENLKSLLKYKDFSFYKGFTEDIEDLSSSYREIQDYIKNYNDEDDTDALEYIIDIIIENYIDLLDNSIHTYSIVVRYIDCLKKKYFFEFIKMLG